MPEFVSKIRFFEVGKEAPPNSSFKGLITTASIFGDIEDGSSWGSKFDYDRRFVDTKDAKQGSLVDYTGRFIKDEDINHTYTSMGFLDTEEKVKTFREMSYNLNKEDGSIVWECILSLKDVMTADRYGMYGQKQLAAALDPVIGRFFKHNGFEPENMMFWMDFHQNESKKGDIHPHIHFQFFEIEKTRSRGTFSKKVIDDFKRDFAIELVKRSEHADLYENYLFSGDEYKKQLIEATKLTDLKKIKDVEDFYKMLPKSGRLQYNSYKLKPYREAIDRTIEVVLNREPLKERYKNFVEQLEKYDDLINDKVGHPVSTHKEDELRKLKERVGNIILQNKKDDYYDNNKHLKRSTYKSIIRGELYAIRGLIKAGKDALEINTAYKAVYDTLISNVSTLSAYDLNALAKLEYGGNGTIKDTTAAINHMNMAISKLSDNDTYGYSRYNALLSSMYFEVGDSAKGLECLNIGVELGDTQAQYTLGIRQVTGDGVPQNLEEGVHRIVDASQNGDRKASKWLRSNGYTPAGNVRYRSKSKHHVGYAKQHSSRHRIVLRQLENYMDYQNQQVQYAISQYLKEAEKNGLDYEHGRSL